MSRRWSASVRRPEAEVAIPPPSGSIPQTVTTTLTLNTGDTVHRVRRGQHRLRAHFFPGHGHRVGVPLWLCFQTDRSVQYPSLHCYLQASRRQHFRCTLLGSFGRRVPFRFSPAPGRGPQRAVDAAAHRPFPGTWRDPAVMEHQGLRTREQAGRSHHHHPNHGGSRFADRRLERSRR